MSIPLLALSVESVRRRYPENVPRRSVREFVGALLAVGLTLSGLVWGLGQHSFGVLPFVMVVVPLALAWLLVSSILVPADGSAFGRFLDEKRVEAKSPPEQ